MDSRPVAWSVASACPTDFKEAFPEMDPLLLQLLWNRGVRTQEEMDVFLGPDWSRDVHPPSLFTRMGQAVARVYEALERGEVITVYGDYDADGVCGATVLYSTLRDICRALKLNEKIITSYIPHREREGYGLAQSAVEHIHEHERTRLIITVDCGISNKQVVARARELGMDVIICDHHTVPAELPEAILIHPLVAGETYPNKLLCGTGVAFKLACGLLEEARHRTDAIAPGYEKWLLDLVAIATVTDVMPLHGENRTLEKFGLMVLNQTRRVGLRKLIEVSGGTSGTLDTTSIGFQIGPRINAAGRMDHANEALFLLLEEDEKTAAEFATRLHATNAARQKESEILYQQARAQVGDSQDPLLVAVGEGWALGLVGLVAGKLLSEFHKPVFVVTRDGETYSGSGRSIKGFNITQALQAAAEQLDRFGGHPEACGFSTTGKERFERALSIMREFAHAHLTPELLAETLDIDAEVPLAGVGWDLHRHVTSLAPFGRGNPKPIFVSRGLKVMEARAIGKEGAHLRLVVADERGAVRKMIGFRFGSWAERLTRGTLVDVAYEVGENVWNGSRELQLKIVDQQLVH